MPKSDLSRLFKYVEYVESSGRPDAVSYAGAIGLMGIMPATAAQPGMDTKPVRVSQLTDPDVNREFGESYLTGLHKRLKNPEHVIAAYNWGYGNVKKWVAKGAKFDELPDDTKHYIEGWRGHGKHKMPDNWQRYHERNQGKKVTATNELSNTVEP